jgi:hypothetical protein
MQRAALWRKEQGGHNPSLIVTVKGMDNYVPAFDNMGKGFVTVGDIDNVQAPRQAPLRERRERDKPNPYKRARRMNPVIVRL